jgi:hypothetical protein
LDPALEELRLKKLQVQEEQKR